jgi:hypothetical protein
MFFLPVLGFVTMVFSPAVIFLGDSTTNDP